jgi:hypothetical protein
MPDFQVTYTVNQPYDATHEGITHLGGVGWRRTRLDVIDSLERGVDTFYTMVNGRRADVGVVHSGRGKHLRAHACGSCNDNLLALAGRDRGASYALQQRAGAAKI